jgi:hypothetical protein
VGWRPQIDFLPGQNVHPLTRRANALELRQVWVKVEGLPGRNAQIAMVPIFGELALSTVLSHRTRDLSDIVMRANEEQMIGVIKEMSDRLHFRRGCRLIGSERIEADYHDAIDAGESPVERCHCAIIGDAFNLKDRPPGQRLGLLDEGLEIRFSLIDAVSARV